MATQTTTQDELKDQSILIVKEINAALRKNNKKKVIQGYVRLGMLTEQAAELGMPNLNPILHSKNFLSFRDHLENQSLPPFNIFKQLVMTLNEKQTNNVFYATVQAGLNTYGFIMEGTMEYQDYLVAQKRENHFLPPKPPVKASKELLRMIDNEQTNITRIIQELDDECSHYERHLLKEIIRASKQFPHDVQEYYSTNGKINPQKILSSSSGNLFIPTPALREKYWGKTNYPTTDELYPKLSSAINKIKAIKKLRSTLSDPHINESKRIKNFSDLINTEETQTLIKSHRDSTGVRYLKNVLYTLSSFFVGFGLLFSEDSKGSITFWKSHGRIALEKMQDQLATTPIAIPQKKSR